MARLENVFSEKKIREVEKEDGTKEQKAYMWSGHSLSSIGIRPKACLKMRQGQPWTQTET
jgi:hypothetical protein